MGSLSNSAHRLSPQNTVTLLMDAHLNIRMTCKPYRIKFPNSQGPNDSEMYVIYYSTFVFVINTSSPISTNRLSSRLVSEMTYFALS